MAERNEAGAREYVEAQREYREDRSFREKLLRESAHARLHDEGKNGDDGADQQPDLVAGEAHVSQHR